MDVLLVAVVDVPVERRVSSLFNRVPWLPTEQFFRAGGAGSAVSNVDGLVGHVIDFLGLPAGPVDDRVCHVVDRDVVTESSVDRRRIHNVLGDNSQLVAILSRCDASTG